MLYLKACNRFRVKKVEQEDASGTSETDKDVVCDKEAKETEGSAARSRNYAEALHWKMITAGIRYN